MPNGMYGGVRGKGTKTGQKTFVPRPTRFDGRPQDAGTREITLPHKSAIRSQSPLPLDNGNDAEQTLSCAKG